MAERPYARLSTRTFGLVGPSTLGERRRLTLAGPLGGGELPAQLLDRRGQTRVVTLQSVYLDDKIVVLTGWRVSVYTRSRSIRIYPADRNASAEAANQLLLVFGGAAIFAPFLATNPLAMDFEALMQPPSLAHPIGTDSLGRDNLSRVIYGGRVSLQVGFLSMLIATTTGVTVGLAAGYFGRWTDSVLMRIVDAILAFPGLLLATLMVAVLGPSLRNAMLAIAVGFIPSFARITRANTLSLREKEFVESARALGAGPWWIMFKTILPNTLSPIIVQASLGMSYAILIEASLSFLGLGIQPPTPSWGVHALGGPGVHYAGVVAYHFPRDCHLPGRPVVELHRRRHQGGARPETVQPVRSQGSGIRRSGADGRSCGYRNNVPQGRTSDP